MKYRKNNSQFTVEKEPLQHRVKHQRIQQHIQKTCNQLSEIYEEYLVYYAKNRQANPIQIANIRRILSAFNDFLGNSKTNIANIKIDHVDNFLAELYARLAPSTYRSYLFYIRQFLGYLYQERGILKRNLSLLLVPGPPRAQVIPPKFFRPHELQRLFTMVDLSSKREIRTYAILHLTYTLGLLPREICMITLDDIHFNQSEINLRSRHYVKRYRLPLSDNTIKAVAIYIVRVRPQNNERALFLKLKAPHEPISPSSVSNDLSHLMRKSNFASSSYWLRHTYAQNLLERGASTFEIKEILGHDRIQTAKRYLQIHTKLMREVLFNETL